MNKIIVILFISFSFSVLANLPEKRSFIGDFSYSFNLLIKGSYTQFTTKENIYYGISAIPTIWHSFKHDTRYTSLLASKEIHKHEENISDLGIVLTFPVIPLATYSLSRYRNDEKLLNYAMEFTATVYLTLAESALISFIHVHDRPNKSDLSPWETNFRGESSFPSGHVVPYAILLFKTFQYYGPWTLIPTGAMFYFASKERVKSGKHTMSDVVGSFFLAAFASEGVRKAHQYKNNHSFYKWIWNHQANLGVINYGGKIGPMISWNF